MSLTVLVPTLRPDNAKRLFASFEETAWLAGTQMLFVLDKGAANLEDFGPLPAICLTKDAGKSMIERTNNALEYVETDAVGWMGDDMLFITPHWDKDVVNALRWSPLVYCNDLLQYDKKASSMFMRTKVARALGWILPPWSNHLYVDDAFVRLSERLNGEYLLNTIIEHLHPYNGKAEWDDVYLATNNPDFDAHDKSAYENWLANDIDEDVRRVQECL